MRSILWGQFIVVGVLAAALGAIAVYWQFGSQGGVFSRADLVPKTLTVTEFEQLMLTSDPAERTKILSSDAAFADFVQRESQRWSVLQAAYQHQIDQQAPVRTWMARAAQQVLVEAFVAQHAASKIDPGYPSEDEAREFYTVNPAQFQIPARLHLWQIFLPAADPAERERAQHDGRRLMEDLLSGRADFGQAAAASKHTPSRVNGGYLGLVAVGDLRPEVREVIEAAKEGQILGPVETPEGFHVVKRGAMIASSTVDYDQVKPRVVAHLKQQAQASAQQQIVRDSVDAYPIAIPTETLAQWRAILRQKEEHTEQAKAGP